MKEYPVTRLLIKSRDSSNSPHEIQHFQIRNRKNEFGKNKFYDNGFHDNDFQVCKLVNNKFYGFSRHDQNGDRLEKISQVKNQDDLLENDIKIFEKIPQAKNHS